MRHPKGESVEWCLATLKSEWWIYDCNSTLYSICSVPVVIPLASDTKLLFTSENISTSAIQVRWELELESQEGENYGERDTPTPHNHIFAKLKAGFQMNWQLHGSPNMTSEDKRCDSEWKTMNYLGSFETDFNVKTIANLVREANIYGINESKIWKTLLKHRWDFEFLKTNPCLNESQG